MLMLNAQSWHGSSTIIDTAASMHSVDRNGTGAVRHLYSRPRNDKNVFDVSVWHAFVSSCANQSMTQAKLILRQNCTWKQQQPNSAPLLNEFQHLRSGQMLWNPDDSSLKSCKKLLHPITRT